MRCLQMSQNAEQVKNIKNKEKQVNNGNALKKLFGICIGRCRTFQIPQRLP